MQFGIWTPLPHTIRAEPEMARAIQDLTTTGAPNAPDRSLEFAARLIQRAEQCGFVTTLVAERLLGPDLEAWILATALAARTSKIEIMVAVHPGIVPPQVVAKMAATLDRISGGRLALNIVNGWWQQEMDLFGNGAWLEDPEARSRRMGEFIEVIRAMWTNDHPAIQGEYFHANAALPIKTIQTPHPPLYAASRTPLGKDIIAKTCNAWFAEYTPDRRNYKTNLETIRNDIHDMRARAASHGRTLRYGLSAHMICADTTEDAERQAQDLEDYGKQDRIAQVAAKALGAGLIGTPQILAERIRAYETAGIDLIMLRWHPMAAGLKAFAEKVMPLLRN